LGNTGKYVEVAVLIVITILSFSFYSYYSYVFLNPYLSNNAGLKVNPTRVQLLYNDTINVSYHKKSVSGWVQYFVSMKKHNSTYVILSMTITNYGGNPMVVKVASQNAGLYLIKDNEIPFIVNESTLQEGHKAIWYNETGFMPVSIINKTATYAYNGNTTVTTTRYYRTSNGVLVYMNSVTKNKNGNSVSYLNQTFLLQQFKLAGKNGLPVNLDGPFTSIILLSLVISLSLVAAIIKLAY